MAAVLYGAPPPQPEDVTRIVLEPVRSSVATGVEKLLPVLREALRHRRKSLDPDEAAAMAWLESLAAPRS